MRGKHHLVLHSFHVIYLHDCKVSITTINPGKFVTDPSFCLLQVSSPILRRAWCVQRLQTDVNGPSSSSGWYVQIVKTKSPNYFVRRFQPDFWRSLSFKTAHHSTGSHRTHKRNEPTRGISFLDKIFTDIVSTSTPMALSPVGTADHKTIIWLTSQEPNPHIMRLVRTLKDSSISVANIDTAAQILKAKLSIGITDRGWERKFCNRVL